MDAHMGFSDTACTLIKTCPLGMLVGTGALSSLTRALTGSPFLTILYAV